MEDSIPEEEPRPPRDRRRSPLDWVGDRQTYRIVVLALLVGLLAGCAGVALRWLVTSALISPLAPGSATALAVVGYLEYLFPAVGGLIVGLMVVYLAQEARGAGVGDVVAAIRYGHSRMRPRVAVVKVLATSLAIGSGGSAGIEGPIIQIGSAIGSWGGQRLRVDEDDLRLTVAAGAAAGIAATFNTPLAGVFFALEVILLDFSGRSFGLVALASVAATVVSRLILGDAPIFPVSTQLLFHPLELLLYAVLGVLAAIVGTAFILVLDRLEAAFTAWVVPDAVKPMVGGLAVGAIGLAFPQVFGLGYDTVGPALRGQLPAMLMAALVVAKLLATCFTVGSGSSGGVIGPSLYLGAMLGGAVGGLYQFAFPQLSGGGSSYALAGMAALFTTTAGAPITAIFTIFELTGDYQSTLPLMLTCAVSAYLGRRLSPHTIYSKGLIRRGIDVISGRVSLPPLHGTMFLELLVGPGAEAAGKPVSELGLPAGCILISIKRPGEAVIPRGNTVVLAGDRIVVAARPECVAPVRHLAEG